MPVNSKINLNLILVAYLFLFCGCASTLPIKNTHIDEEPTSETPLTALPPAVSPQPSIESSATIKMPVKKNRDKEKNLKTEDVKPTALELQKFAYELGFDPKEQLSEEQKQKILDRKKLRQLERTLDSQKERLQYSKVLPWLNSDQEKIEILTIPSIEGRQVWINKNKIWSRVNDLKNFDKIVESQDIAIGMPAEYVKRSWGEPSHIEASGNPIYRNERWQYLKQVSTPNGYKQEIRYVYFEGGQVTGWETE